MNLNRAIKEKIEDSIKIALNEIESNRKPENEIIWDLIVKEAIERHVERMRAMHLWIEKRRMGLPF